MTLNLYEHVEDVAARVDCLLHDAEHKDSGARIASIMQDPVAFARLWRDKQVLIDTARRIDPEGKSPAWAEVAGVARPPQTPEST